MNLHHLWHPRSYIASGCALLTTIAAHRAWKGKPDGTMRGILDIACHFGTACAVTLPVLPNTSHVRQFGLTALVSAIALDLDHVVAARSLEMRSWMSMPSRPPTHSLPAMLAFAIAIEHAIPGKRLWLAIALGVGSHLLRDLATGGAPLWHPRRVISWPVPLVIALLVFLPLVGRFLAGLPLRETSVSCRS